MNVLGITYVCKPREDPNTLHCLRGTQCTCQFLIMQEQDTVGAQICVKWSWTWIGKVIWLVVILRYIVTARCSERAPYLSTNPV